MADTISTSVNGVTQPPTYAPISFLFNAAALGLGIAHPPDRVRLDVITVDATMQETHAAEADVTEHPVEKGANISDHIRPKLKRYTIDGIISNTPIDVGSEVVSKVRAGALAAGITMPSVPGPMDIDNILAAGATTRAKATFEQLVQLVDEGLPITIHTPLHDYPSMALESVSVVRTPDLSRGGIRFLAVCKEVRTVAALKTVTSAVPDSAQPATDLGAQNPSPASDKVSGPARSVIKSFTNSMGWTRPRGR